jgi:hypothetical protein
MHTLTAEFGTDSVTDIVQTGREDATQQAVRSA